MITVPKNDVPVGALLVGALGRYKTCPYVALIYENWYNNLLPSGNLPVRGPLRRYGKAPAAIHKRQGLFRCSRERVCYRPT